MFRQWVPSLVAAGVVTAGIVVPGQAQAVDLPERTVEELLAAIDQKVTGFSGIVTKTSELGLPELEMSQMMSEDMVVDMEERMPEGFEDFVPRLVDQNSFTDAIALLAGTDSIRVYASAEGVRAQILDPMSQRDIIVNDSEAWFYDASTNEAITREFDQSFSRDDFDDLNASLELDLSNPDEVAKALLTEARQYATITVGDDHRVAGRDAYRLVVTPNSSHSLVDRIELSVDAETGLGLAVNFYSTEQAEAAISLAFDEISFETPDASLFQFSPPPGATVEVWEFPETIEQALTELSRSDLTEAEREQIAESVRDEFATEFADGVSTDTVGEGFDTVVTMSALPEAIPMEMLENELFAELMQQVDGGRVLSTPLSTTLITDDGRVFAGAVTVDYLLELSRS